MARVPVQGQAEVIARGGWVVLVFQKQPTTGG